MATSATVTCLSLLSLLFLAASARTLIADPEPVAPVVAPEAGGDVTPLGAIPPNPASGAGAVPVIEGPDHTLTFFMHDILGGSNPSAKAVTGAVTNPAVNGQVPFAKPNGANLPVNNGVPQNDGNNGIINNNNLPFLTGLGGTTSNVFQNNNNNNNNNNNVFAAINGGQLPQGNALQQFMFGTLTVIDDELTEGHELGSGLIGKAQGFYVSSSIDGKSQTMAFTVMFMHGSYIDSLSFMGVHRSAVAESQLAVMGGTGKYVNAKGHAVVKTLTWKILIQVSVNFDQSYDRVPHPDTDLENSISEIWDKRVQQSSSLFNGKKFRYRGHDRVGPNVCLHLGLTDYRTFVGTNLNPLWERFLVSSEDDCKQCKHTSSPLGNGAVVETVDNKILVLQRSNNVGEFPGYLVFPGGHPEPEEVGITSHKCENGLQNSESSNSKVSWEMFDSIIREVVEEIGVPAATLSDPLLIGISRRVLNVRPAAFFFIKCSLQSTQVQKLNSSAQDGYESTKLYTIGPSELENMASKMPGCHRGGFALYKLMLAAGNDIK